MSVASSSASHAEHIYLQVQRPSLQTV